MMRSFRVAFLSLCLAVTCAVLAELGYSSISTFRGQMFTVPPPTAVNLPVYPDAQQVKETAKEDGSKLLTFQVQDTPESVLSFYSRILLRNGWVNPLICSGVPRTCSYPKQIFAWDQGGPDGPTRLAYRIKVDAKKISPLETSVEVRVVKYDPIQGKPPFEQ